VSAHDPEQVSEPVRPFLPWMPPTDEIRLFTGPMSFWTPDGNQLPPALGRIDLLLRAGSHLNWLVDLDSLGGTHRRDWERGARAATAGQLHFDLNGCPTTIPVQALAAGRGSVAGCYYAAPSASIERIVTHCLNLPDVGPHDLLRADQEDGRWVEWRGRRVIEAPPWLITLDSRNDHHEAYREARRSYRSVLTHTMEVRRIDGQPFTADLADRILKELQMGFSFPLGRWAAPILSIGLERDGVPVFSAWGPWHAETPGLDADRWWPEHRAEFLDDYLPKLMSAFNDPVERGHLRFLITSAIATSQKAYTEQRLATGLAALEYLSWIDEVLSGAKSEQQWRYKNTAAKRIRRRLLNARIPLIIDSSRLPELALFAQPDHLDGPDAITLVRDHVTHPKDRQVIYGPASPLSDAARLASRYLDLLILHRIRYIGVTRDRTKTTGWEGDSEAVPWGLPRSQSGNPSRQADSS
jgi:hypothetical protein